jgi:hypothetical protein
MVRATRSIGERSSMLSMSHAAGQLAGERVGQARRDEHVVLHAERSQSPVASEGHDH